MVAAITAQVQNATPAPRVLITVTGLAGSPPASAAVVYRVVGGVTVGPVRPAPLPANTLTIGTAVIVDNEAPFNQSVTYAAVVTRGTTTKTEATSNPVTLTSRLPVLSDPVQGTGVAITVALWPELKYEHRAAVMSIAGTPDPYVESDVPVAAHSVCTLWSPTLNTLTAARAVLSTGQVVLLRANCDGVEDGYFAVTSRIERRHGSPGRGWERFIELEVQETGAPSLAMAGIGDTLADLHTTVPGTLRDINTRWPGKLLDIAQTNLSGV